MESAFNDNFTMLDKRLTELLSNQWERLTPPSPIRKIARQGERDDMEMEIDHNKKRELRQNRKSRREKRNIKHISTQ